MNLHSRTLIFVLLTIPAILYADVPHKIELSSCNIEGIERAARCGALDVPENPQKPDGRHLKINVVIIPASNGNALPDPIVPLMGGPGEDAISAAAIFAEQFATLLKDRDLLLIDQRGTGRSNALRCELYSSKDPGISLRDLFPVEAVNRCLQELKSHADLSQYSYTNFANDIEQIRNALGYQSLNLIAGSYGTRAAQVFIRTYPKSVRTAYLGSVVPIDVPTPLTMAKTSQQAFEDTFSACEKDANCKSAFPNLRDEFHEIVDRLESGSVGIKIQLSDAPVTIHRGRVIEFFRSLVYRPSSAADLPLLIHHAFLGNWKPIATGIVSQAQSLDSGLSIGLFFSITCNEDIAFIKENEVRAQTQGTVLGDYRLRQQQAACKDLPKVSLSTEYRKPVKTAVETLFVSGDNDGATPLWFTEHTAPGFSNKAEIVARGQGHTEWSDCISRLCEKFVLTGLARSVAGSTCEPIPRPPFRIIP
jgi:pimeloyl-ACP methyl ester carboxylesterase